MTENKIVIGSRGSKLALIYAEKVKKTVLDKNINLSISIKIIKRILNICLIVLLVILFDP